MVFNPHLLQMNLHNHSLFSDGKQSVNSLIEYAITTDIKLLGISDHAGTMKTPSLPLSKISQYEQLVRTLAERYKDKIKVLAGIEIDSCINRTPDLHQLPYEQINRLDYVLFEYINNPYWNGINLQQLGYIRRKLGIPVGLAHPDITFLCGEMSVEEVIDFLEDHAIFIELSSKEPSGYRNHVEFFNALRNRNIRVSIGSDTHYALEDLEDIHDPVDFIRECSLENNLVSEIFLS